MGEQYINEAVKRYIKEQQQLGLNSDQIRQLLYQSGWTKEQVDYALPAYTSVPLKKKMSPLPFILAGIILVLGIGGYFAYAKFFSESSGNNDNSEQVSPVDFTFDTLYAIRETSVVKIDTTAKPSTELEVFSFVNTNDEKPPAFRGTRRLLSDGVSLYAVYGSGIDHISYDGELLQHWERPLTEYEIQQQEKQNNSNGISQANLPFVSIASAAQLAQVGFFGNRSDMISAAELYGDYLLLSANGHFIVLTKDLKEVASVDLELSKNADDILIYDNKALLLDDIWSPYYIISVDISNPSNPEIISWLDSAGVNAGLNHQWIDDKGNWYVNGSYGSQGGNGAWIATITPGRYTYKNSLETAGFDDYSYDDEDQFSSPTSVIYESDSISDVFSSNNGYQIYRDLDNQSDYFLIHFIKDDNDGELILYLASLNSEFEPTKDLKMKFKKDGYINSFLLQRYNDQLIVSAGKNLILIDDSGSSPREQVRVQLEEQIYDVMPHGSVSTQIGSSDTEQHPITSKESIDQSELLVYENSEYGFTFLYTGFYENFAEVTKSSRGKGFVSSKQEPQDDGSITIYLSGAEEYVYALFSAEAISVQGGAQATLKVHVFNIDDYRVTYESEIGYDKVTNTWWEYDGESETKIIQPREFTSNGITGYLMMVDLLDELYYGIAIPDIENDRVIELGIKISADNEDIDPVSEIEKLFMTYSEIK